MSLAHKGLDSERVPTPFIASRGRGRRVEDGAGHPRRRQVVGSFAIALYLDEAYPERPTLFGGEGGKAMARFIERWSQLTIHPYLGGGACRHPARLAPPDQAYFRESREKRYGKTLEEVSRAARRAWPASALRSSRCAACSPTSPSSAAHRRSLPTTSSSARSSGLAHLAFQMLAEDDPVAAWFERCLDLHGGLGRSVAAA